MQAVILAGGLATRLRPLTAALPKSLVPVADRPFIEYQLALLRLGGVNDIVLCVGHLRREIVAVVGDGSRFGVRVRYSEETGGLLGTAGALRQARALLADRFLVTYGDSYLRCDYAAVLDLIERRGALGVMVVYRNGDLYDRSNVIIGDGLVRRYDKRRREPGMVHIDAGVLAFRAEVLDRLPAFGPASLDEDLLPQLADAGELLAYENEDRFYEVGSFSGLAEFERYVTGSGRR